MNIRLELGNGQRAALSDSLGSTLSDELGKPVNVLLGDEEKTVIDFKLD